MPFMRYFALIVIIIVFCLALVFSMQNRSEAARLTFGGTTTEPIPIFFIILGAFLVGVVFTSVIGIIEGMKQRVTNARLRRKLRKLQSEVDALRNLPLSGPTDPERSPVPEYSDEESAL